MEARVGIEPTNEGFADLSLPTWVPRLGQHSIAKPYRGFSTQWPSAPANFRNAAP